MKKLLILLFIFSIGCFGQLTRKPAGLVGLKDTTNGVKSNGVGSFYFGTPFNYVFDYSRVKMYWDDYASYFSVNSLDGEVNLAIASNFTTENSTDIQDMSPIFDIIVRWNDGSDYVNYSQLITNDSSLAILNVADNYGLHIRPSGQLQSVTENGTENVLTNFGTLSGTIYVKDTNDAVKSLTFTNGLLTASDFEEFAGVFKVNDSNLTQSNFKQSPDYAEFLEFQKYLYMKKSLAQKE